MAALDRNTVTALIDLHNKGLSSREISFALDIGKTTVNTYVKKYKLGVGKGKCATTKVEAPAQVVVPQITKAEIDNAIAASVASQLQSAIKAAVDAVVRYTLPRMVQAEVETQMAARFTFASKEDFEEKIVNMVYRKMQFRAGVTSRPSGATDISYLLTFGSHIISQSHY